MTANADEASMSRRRLLRTGGAGAVAAAGLAAGTGTAAAQYDGWLDDVSNYDGTHDYRGQDEVTVEVGAVDGLKFGPAAILIDPGTTVVWEWTGEGGAHNVVATDETFDSGETVNEEGYTFEYTFEDAAEGDTFNYLCVPHEAVEMKGSVAIGEVDDDIVSPDGGDGGGGDGSGDGGGDGDGGDGSEDGDGGGSGGDAGGRDLTASDLGALALGLGVAGSLLVPLFYAAHQKAEKNQ